MHQAVACTQCHEKMVFSNVGQRCQDCHADIHRRQLGANCEQCHTVRGWNVTVQQIQDHNNRFPLTGAHAAVDCDACHKNAANSKFETMSVACFSCHQSDYNAATNPNHVTAKFSVTCDTCHSTDNWLNAKFDHNTMTNFPLTGLHTVPPRQCTDCHVNNNYNLTNTTCVGCHMADFQGTKNPNHVAASFPTNCAQCHTTGGWSPASFDHNTVNFPLTGMHTVPPRQCTDCHINGNYNLTTTTCISCHLKDFQGTTNPNHVSGGFAQTCEICHTTSAWQPATFDHSKTAFPLTGNHMVPPRQCTDCHVNNNYNITNTACVSCHQTDYNNANAPVAHASAGFPTTCEQCHDTNLWTDGVFNHTSTGFTLTGLHTVPPRQCSDCHTNNNYNITTGTCVSCHLKDFQSTTSPNHVTSNLPQTCENCHTTATWLNATFNHDTTGFPLTGNHMVPPRACVDCHINNNYTLTNTACVSCHQTDYNNATTPVAHASAGLPTTCEQCHDTNLWTDGTFNHASTGFTLTGLHTVPPRQCTDCHVNNNYNITTTTCVSCHLKDFQTTNNPNHVTSNFPQTCEQCHTTATWLNATFNHDSTGFPLTGNHTVPPRACVDCHVNNNYSITNTACVSCHQTDYNNATTPVAHAGFPTTCEQCHDTNLWTDGKFNHASTGFTLTGLHTVPPRQCSDCHTNNNYSLNSTACVTCHLKDYQGTTNPNHVTSNLPQTCDVCHSTATWMNATFNHNNTGFPLTGNHTVPPRACVDCHVNNNYSITNTACVSCHQTDYNNATTPVAHASAGFPTTCEQCHDTNLWTDGTFNHASTGFTLTGLHTVPPRVCTDCHVNNNYNITTTTCVSCHLKDFQTTTNPNHVSSNFPQTCEQCHTTATWLNATFNHDTTGFPLTGNHTVPPRACVDCHVNNNYTITNTACVSCHQTDYNNATTPVAHAAAGFPTTCEQCHDTNLWTDGKFNHASTGFTLTGLHTVPPRLCSDCHVNNNYALNSTACVTCHLKDYQGTTNPNHVSSNFPQTCDQCHSTASWLNATFNHNTTGFPLTGNHMVPPRACTDCHVNNNYTITNTACVSCHQTDYNNATTPVAHAAAGFPTTCEQCHDTNLWTDGTFNHASTGFTLTGLHTVPPRLCSDCHVNNNYALNSTACVTCHLKDYQGTTNPNHVSSNFPQTCDQCHSTASWLNATFNHNTTGFPLTGNHMVPPRACTDCHINNNYTITNTACVSCHQTDYNNATTPVAHAAAGFPTTCQNCHDTNLWTDGTFNHASTGFTLTGLHTVPPRLCSDCHVSNNYSLNSTACVTCHLKDYQGTTNPNHVSSNFPQTCDTCHTTATWLNATFNHNSTGFPLTGAHTVPPRACTDCHVNGNYNLNSTFA